MASLSHTNTRPHAYYHICLPVSLRRVAAFVMCAVRVKCFSLKLQAAPNYLAFHTNLAFGSWGRSVSKSLSPPTLVINRLLCSTEISVSHSTDVGNHELHKAFDSGGLLGVIRRITLCILSVLPSAHKQKQVQKVVELYVNEGCVD